MTVYIGSEIQRKLIPYRSRKGILVYDMKLKKEALNLVNSLPGVVLKGFRVTEKVKGLTSAETLYTQMLRGGLDRESVLFSLGGGALGDLAGFVASTYLRGIEWVNIPTTLLAQIDAAIGGKTALNHSLSKNSIGTFYPPQLILCSPRFLESLPTRERISGLGEMIKYGLIRDPSLYRSLEKHWKRYLALEPLPLGKGIRTCVKIKQEIVAQDERDTLGVRQLLNFGHTFGHAIEAATDYRIYRHGEAVIEGMRIALILSVLQGHMDRKEQQSIDRFLSAIPTPHKRLDSLLDFVERDKKRRRGKIGFVLLKTIGEPLIDDTVTRGTMQRALKEWR